MLKEGAGGSRRAERILARQTTLVVPLYTRSGTVWRGRAEPWQPAHRRAPALLGQAPPVPHHGVLGDDDDADALRHVQRGDDALYVAECALAIAASIGTTARRAAASPASRGSPIARRHFAQAQLHPPRHRRTTCCWTPKACRCASRRGHGVRAGALVVRRQGRIVLSDFGLCTGLKKSHQTILPDADSARRGAVLRQRRSVPTRASRAWGRSGRDKTAEVIDLRQRNGSSPGGAEGSSGTGIRHQVAGDDVEAESARHAPPSERPTTLPRKARPRARRGEVARRPDRRILSASVPPSRLLKSCDWWSLGCIMYEISIGTSSVRGCRCGPSTSRAGA